MSDELETSVQPGLKKGQLRTLNLLILAMALVGPGASAFFNLSSAGAIAGPAMALSIVFAFIAILFLVNTVAQFAGRVPGAGMFYTFVSQGLGAKLGFLAGWILMADYGFTVAFCLVFPADQVSSLLQKSCGVNIPWWLIFLIALGVVVWLAIRGIKPSIQIDTAFLIYELAALLALSLTVLFKIGPAHWSPVPFMFPKTGLGSVGLACVLCITGFLGFEGSITASEESVNPRGVLPKVLFGAVIITGIFYVVTNYAGVVGYGLPSMSKIANDPLPWNTIANHYWGNGWGILVDIGAWISMFACAIAGMNASSRLWFAMGRENVLPAWLGVVKTERCVPLNAIYLETVITLIFGVGLGLLLGPFPCFLFLGILLSIGALIVWILAGISLIRFMYTKRRDEFRVIPHVIVPILSIIFVIPPLYSTVWPIPESPLNYALYLAVVWIVVGLILLWRLTVNNPGAIAQAGKIMVED